ncbi:MAG: RND transporter [Bacteroidetes bacterium 47-18]|nr:MAG: RND transporter [Bacteroidetes bacterium 47-18]
MKKKQIIYYTALICGLTVGSCGIPRTIQKSVSREMPGSYNTATDSATIAELSWRDYFKDPYLAALIDTALANNQELHIVMQEIAIARNEAKARKGEYLPSIGFRAGAGAEKRSEKTLLGRLERDLDIEHGKKNPEPLPDFVAGFSANWEVDIWKKLRNARQAAVLRYLASVEGKNFMVTQLVGEIADTYYELLALDQQLGIVNANIKIQTDALEVVKLQKAAARTTELAVRKFEAEVLKTQSLQYEIRQQLLEAENKLGFLLGKYPHTITRTEEAWNSVAPVLHTGLPAQLLDNRPDIRQAELELKAAQLDIKVAKAQFYPSLGLSAGIGLQAFNPAYLIKMPESLLMNLAGDLVAPLVNRNAIKATYLTANAHQVQAAYNYEQKLLNAYIEVVNHLNKINNLQQSIDLRSRQVKALNQSIEISNDLFTSARADYMEVLMTQRDALESKFELIESQKAQKMAQVNVYRALGGGWK